MCKPFDLPYECPRSKGVYFYSQSTCKARLGKAGKTVALGWSAGGGTKEALYEECVGCSGPVSRTIEEEKIVEAVKKMEKKVCEENKNLYVCEIHGEHNGRQNGRYHISACPACHREKIAKSMAEKQGHPYIADPDERKRLISKRYNEKKRAAYKVGMEQIKGETGMDTNVKEEYKCLPQVNEDRAKGNEYMLRAIEVGGLVAAKQEAYGDSFGKAGQVLEILYPDGIQPEQYGDMLCVVRIIDKLFRVANQKDAFGESPYKDIAGYGLLGLVKAAK